MLLLGQCFVIRTCFERVINSQSVCLLAGEKVLTVDVVSAVVKIFAQPRQSIGFSIKPMIWFNDVPFD